MSAPHYIHASCVAFDGRGVLIRGAAGRGKSSLALQLLALGGTLVSDDQTLISAAGPKGEITASAPERLSGMIEARGIGLIGAPFCKAARIELVVDLDQEEHSRLPPARTCALWGHDVALLYGPVTAHFPAAIILFLRYGWRE